MKNLLRITACILAIAMATSIIGAAFTGSGSGTVNTKRGEITDEELRTFFTGNRSLLQSIASQLIPLREEIELFMIYKNKSQIIAQDGVTRPVALGASLLQQLEQYFSVAGTANTPEILVHEIYTNDYTIVSFSFNLAVGHNKGIMYSTDHELWADDERCEELETDWYIFERFAGGPPIMPPCWTRLPAWLQWILRYVFFGWFWMKP